MSNIIKLSCPKCDKQFETNIPNKVWCSKMCSNEFRDIEKKIGLNKFKQVQVRRKDRRYDLENDKFYINNYNI